MISLDWYNKQQAIVAAAKQKQDIAVAELMWQQGLAERRERYAEVMARHRLALGVELRPAAPQAVLAPRVELCLVGRL